MFSITFGCEQGWGQCFPMPWFPHRASRHLQHSPLLLPSTPACQSNSALLVQSPSSQHVTYRLRGSQTLPRCPSRWLHKGWEMIPWVSQGTWPDQVNPALWYLFMTGGPSPSSQSHINKQPGAQKFLASYQAWSSLSMISHTPGSSSKLIQGHGESKVLSEVKTWKRQAGISPVTSFCIRDLDGLEISAHAWVTKGK